MFLSKKDDAKTEKVIRGLLKLPANRRCINCNVLGPQYVCTTFSTFVCINCSGIHREFTHRVKSVSMAKFSPEEVAALEAGGNERAKQLYLKEWDSLRHSFPDPNNMHRLRDFIKHVYVDRKFTGERGTVVLPSKLRLKDKEESFESKKIISSLRSESKNSPNYEDRNERHHGDRSSPSTRSDDKSLRFYYDESRSPKYAHRYAQPGTFGRSPIKFEVVDDRFRDDGPRTRRLSNLEPKSKQLPPDGRQKNVEGSQPSVARPVKEESKENGPSPRLQVGGEPSQSQNKEAAQNQVTHNNGGSSAEKKPTEQKINPPEKYRASDVAAEPETQPTSQATEDNWASFEAFTADNAPETSNTKALTVVSSTIETTPKATYANSLDLLLSELSGALTVTTSVMPEASITDNNPTTATSENISSGGDLMQLPPNPIVQTTALPKNSNALSVTSNTANEMKQPSTPVTHLVDLFKMEESVEVSNEPTLSSIQFPPTASVSSSTTQPSTAVPPQVYLFNIEDSGKVSNEATLSSFQFPHTSSARSSTTQPTTTPVRPATSNNLLSDVPNLWDSSGGFIEQSAQETKPVQNAKPDAGSQTSPVEAKSSGRMELPADLFTSSYLSGPAPLSGWQNVQAHGMGYGLQYYPNAMPPSAFPIAANSTNPFDQTEGRTIAHTISFPTLSSMNGVLPAASPLVHSSSYGSMSMMPQHPGYASQVPPQSTLASGFPTGVYYGQINNNMQPTRPERVGTFNVEYNAPGAPNSFSKIGGNPFD